MYEERQWGCYSVLENLDGMLTKHLTIKKGKAISYQFHHHRDEMWTFVKGSGVLVLDGVAREVSIGDFALIKAGTFHTVYAREELHIIEVQTGDPLIEEDIERFSFDWEEYLK